MPLKPYLPHDLISPFENVYTAEDRRRGRIGLAWLEAQKLLAYARDWKAEGRPDMASKLIRGARQQMKRARRG